MAANTKISWTSPPGTTPGRTWNPLYGCSRVSEGCRHCYAEQVVAGLARKMRGSPAGEFYGSLVRETPAGPRWTGEVKIHEGRLLDPLKWREPVLVFVNSLSDVFHDSVSLRDIARIWAIMGAAPRQTFQVLTKRPRRALEVLSSDDFLDILQGEIDALFSSHGAGRGGFRWPLPNVWLGVSVEDQRAANERIPLLLQTPAALRWLSCEPLLGPVDLEYVSEWQEPVRRGHGREYLNCLTSHVFVSGGRLDFDPEEYGDGAGIGWVVVGGESGPGARGMRQEWADSLKTQCARARVPFFFKQHSAPRAGTVYPERLPGGVVVREFPGSYSQKEEASRG